MSYFQLLRHLSLCVYILNISDTMGNIFHISQRWWETHISGISDIMADTFQICKQDRKHFKYLRHGGKHISNLSDMTRNVFAIMSERFEICVSHHICDIWNIFPIMRHISDISGMMENTYFLAIQQHVILKTSYRP